MAEAVASAVAVGGNVVVATGAGISVPSGPCSYRGKGGRWTEEGTSAMAKVTAAFFFRNPREGWAWSLTRRGEVRAAEPNAGHDTVVELDRILGDRFVPITQNVDRLHLRAGSPPGRTIEIHGYLDGMRCTAGCPGVVPVPCEFDGWSEGDEIAGDYLESLTCPECTMVTRPHLLFFDEYYDEENYRIESAQRAVEGATLCITVGTSGGVPIAERLARIAVEAGATLVDVNPDNNALRRLAFETGGYTITQDASVGLSMVIEAVQQSSTHEGDHRDADELGEGCQPQPYLAQRLRTDLG